MTEIDDPQLRKKGVILYIKREDLNHPTISGNKLRKLKYNLENARNQGLNTLLTFGGAFSNHIYAVAAAGQAFGFNTIGMIRGEEHLPLNDTLSFARKMGMQLHYIDRTSYRNKDQPDFVQTLRSQFGDFYLIPEGGTNALAIQGCEEIIDQLDIPYDILCCPVGTGGTITGLISALKGSKEVLGFSSLKGNFLEGEVNNLLKQHRQPYPNWNINGDYHFGGYAKIKTALTNFILAFEEAHQIPIEPIYTAKMLFGIFDMVLKDKFQPGTRIIALHTGGLQGNAGFDFRKSL